MRTILFTILMSFLIYPQQNQWLNLVGGNMVSDFAEDDNYMWIASNSGILKIDKSNNQGTFLNKANSGLPSLYILSFTKDDFNNIWMGTGDGLVRYDGINWTVWDTLNSGLPENTISELVFDNNGNLWMATYGGAVKYDGSVWTVYDTSNSGLPTNTVRDVAIDSVGNIWFGSDSGVTKYNGFSWQVYNTQNSGIPSEWVYDISVDANNLIWFGTNAGAAKFDNTNWFIYNTSNSGIPSNGIAEISFDNQNYAWFSTAGGAAMFDGMNWTVYDTSNSGLPDSHIRTTFFDNESNVWFGTRDYGAVKFNGANWEILSTSNCGLPSNLVWSIYTDNENKMWISSFGFLVKFSNPGWILYEQAYGKLAIIQDKLGNMWFGTASGDILKFDGISWVTYHPFTNYFAEVTGAVVDDNNTLWFSSSGEVAKFDWNTWTLYSHYNSGLPVGGIFGMSVDKFNSKWFAVNGGGAVKFDDIMWTVYDTTNSQIPTNYPWKVAIDSLNNKWFATGDKGVLKFNDTTWIQFDTSNSNLLGNDVRSLEVDKDGNIWAGPLLIETNNFKGYGVSAYNGIIWINYTEQNSPLTEDWVNFIEHDDSNNIWIGTMYGGITVYNENGIVLSNETKLDFTEVPTGYLLLQNYPNPFNPVTTIKFNIPQAGNVYLRIYDILGREIKTLVDEFKNPGNYKVDFDASFLASGVYLYRLQAGNYFSSKKMVLIK